MGEELVDAGQVLDDDVELANDGVALDGGEGPVLLADDVVEEVVVALQEDGDVGVGRLVLGLGLEPEMWEISYGRYYPFREREMLISAVLFSLFCSFK